MNIEVNLLAVLFAGVASMVVGFVWYSPFLFGNTWMKLMGHSQKSMKAAQAKMGMMYMMSFAGSLLMAFVFYHFVKQGQYFYQMDLLGAGLASAFWAWLGLVMPVQLTDVMFGEKKWMLFFINTGYQLVSLLAMGVVFGIVG